MKLIKNLVLFVSLFGAHDVVSSHGANQGIEMNHSYSRVPQNPEGNNTPQQVVSQPQSCSKCYEWCVVIAMLTGCGAVGTGSIIVIDKIMLSNRSISQSHPRVYTFDNQTPAAVIAKCTVNTHNELRYKELIDADTTANFSCSPLSQIQVCSSYDNAIKCARPTDKTNKHEHYYKVSYSRLYNDDFYTGKLSLTPIHSELLSTQDENHTRQLKYLNYTEKKWRELEQS